MAIEEKKDINEFLVENFALDKKKGRSKKKSEQVVQRFLGRYENILEKEYLDNEKQEGIKKFKQNTFEKHIIKEENISQKYWNLQEQILENDGHGNIEIDEQTKESEYEKIVSEQKSSLEYWIKYLSSTDANYPVGLKYWAFKSILKLQSFDKQKGKFQKRTKSTVSNFPELNQEALAYSFDFILQKIKKEEIKKPNDNIDDDIFQKIINKSNFGDIYGFALKNINKTSDDILQNISGEWIKYEQNSDHMPLVNSISGKATGWCTVGESTAQTQISGGDFYVYYSEDEKGKNTIPRVAIRMNGKNKIAEIRGIADKQNLDEYISPVIDRKLKDFGTEADSYSKKRSDMDKLTNIYSKFKENKNIEFSKKELRFLYEIDSKIEGFGYGDDRIKKILRQRNINLDLSKIFNFSENEIVTTMKEVMSQENDTKYFHGESLFIPINILEIGFKFPEYINGFLSLPYIQYLPKGVMFPKIIRGNMILNTLLELPEGIKLPENIGGSLELENLIKIPEDIKLPENIGGSLDLGGLKEIPENFKLPESIRGKLYLENLNQKDQKKLLDKYPEYKDKFIFN